MSDELVSIPRKEYNHLMRIVNLAAELSVFRDELGCLCRNKETLARDHSNLQTLSIYIQHYMGADEWYQLRDRVTRDGINERDTV